MCRSEPGPPDGGGRFRHRVPPLEPRPDRWTGLPRPIGGAAEDGAERPGRPTAPPPDGRGPALEWTTTDPRTASLVGLAVLLFGVALMTVASTGFSWVTAWGAWVFIAVVVIAFRPRGRRTTLEVGSDWLRMGRTWVDLYELDRIRGNYFVKMDWTVRDSSGRRLKVSDESLHENPDAWALVRTGFEHSVAAGATTNRPARQRLGLGDHLGRMSRRRR